MQSISKIDVETEHAARVFLERIATKYQPIGARLYGSRARGDHDKFSDADLVVFLKGARSKKSDFVNTTLAMADIAFEVLLDTDVLVSPLPIWEEEWNHPDTYSNPRLLENIRREGVAL